MRWSQMLRAPKRALLRFRDDARGVMTLELAAVAGPLVIGLVIGADMAMSLHTRNKINSAAQAGAQYAVLNGFNVTAIKTAVTNSTSLSGMVISDPVKFCGCPTSTTITTATCGSSCSGSAATAGNYVRVHVEKTYTPMFAFNTVGESGSLLQATTTVRLP